MGNCVSFGKTGENVDEVLEAASRAWKRMNSTGRNNSGDDDKEKATMMPAIACGRNQIGFDFIRDN